MVVGTLRLCIRLHGCRSLKEKRHAIRSLKDQLQSRFKVSVAEVDDQDLHQSAVLGVSFVASDGKNAQSRLQNLVNFIEDYRNAVVVAIDKEILHED